MLNAHYYDRNAGGTLRELEGETLAALAEQLVELSFDPGQQHLAVFEDCDGLPAVMRGWVGTQWLDGANGEPELRPYWRAA